MRKTFYLTAAVAVLIHDNFTNAMNMKPNNQFSDESTMLTQTQTVADIYDEPTGVTDGNISVPLG